MFQDGSDSGGDAGSVFTRDEMLDDIMLYWLTNTGASSARLYWEAQSSMSEPPLGIMHIPTAISMFSKELVRISRHWVEKRFSNLLEFNKLNPAAILRLWSNPHWRLAVTPYGQQFTPMRSKSRPISSVSQGIISCMLLNIMPLTFCSTTIRLASQTP